MNTSSRYLIAVVIAKVCLYSTIRSTSTSRCLATAVIAKGCAHLHALHDLPTLLLAEPGRAEVEHLAAAPAAVSTARDDRHRNEYSRLRNERCGPNATRGEHRPLNSHRTLVAMRARRARRAPGGGGAARCGWARSRRHRCSRSPPSRTTTLCRGSRSRLATTGRAVFTLISLHCILKFRAVFVKPCIFQ